jgi:hypothetical protein
VFDPVEKIHNELQGKKEYAIILNDMREAGNFFPSYYHQYRVDVEEQKTVRSFVEVDKSYYKKNEPYLGMVLAAKTADGAVTTTPFPNGYQYVGNPQYGRWRLRPYQDTVHFFYNKICQLPRRNARFFVLRHRHGIGGSRMERSCPPRACHSK